MKATKYFYTMIATAGMSLGTLALAQEAEIEEGEQSRCDIAASAIEEQQYLGILDIRNDSATEAFCFGLQSHGDESSVISFKDGWSVYTGSPNKAIMGKNVWNYSGGLGSARCIPVSGGPAEGCNQDLNPALKLVYPPHLDYSDPEFSQSTTYVGSWTTANIALGDYVSVTLEGNSRANLYSASRYNIKNLTIGHDSLVYLNGGDYYIEKLTMHDRSKIIVSAGTARIFLKNNPYLADYAALNWRKDPRSLLVIADGDLSAYRHVSIAGYVYAGGDISLTNYCVIEGAVSAENVGLNDNSIVTEKRGTIAYVDFGEITADPLPWDGSLLVYAPDEGRHTGTYALSYPSAQANEFLTPIVDNELYDNVANVVNNEWLKYLDPDTYLNNDIAEAADLLLDPDAMVIGHIYGVITISVSGVPFVPFAVDIPILLNLPLSEADIIENKNAKKAEIDTEVFNPDESYQDTYEGEDIYGHPSLVDAYPSAAERDAALEELRAAQHEEIDNLYAGIVAEWNAARKLKAVPTSVQINTWYPDPAQGFGFASRSFNSVAGNWVGIMNHNDYAGLPIVFPINLFPVIGYYSAAWCGAWVAAFEVGCFQPEYGEPGYVEGVPSNACSATLEEGAGPVPVDAALHSFAGANLTCGVVVFNVAMTATIGFAIETHPVGSK